VLEVTIADRDRHPVVIFSVGLWGRKSAHGDLLRSAPSIGRNHQIFGFGPAVVLSRP